VRNPHAGQPFTNSDEEIAEALLDVSIPTLMLSLVHMAGDPVLIRGALKPAGLFLNEVQGYMSEEDKSAVRTNRAEGDRRLPGPRLPRARADHR
jgi:4-hydroxyacetophenone monooxygenase